MRVRKEATGQDVRVTKLSVQYKAEERKSYQYRGDVLVVYRGRQEINISRATLDSNNPRRANQSVAGSSRASSSIISFCFPLSDFDFEVISSTEVERVVRLLIVTRGVSSVAESRRRFPVG